eukprot:TRINITY_DN39629_c0_g1_i1.p1 TRINITY_DN39629_c0_g1~~TRINITY_DN39629_c0_g1_i1.p1  ORF type:complete len:211 (+),score=73.76 TRINITY_DN39629_c0_g1_i1:187-819(+)
MGICLTKRPQFKVSGIGDFRTWKPTPAELDMLWNQYDRDSSGHLDGQESYRLVADITSEALRRMDVELKLLERRIVSGAELTVEVDMMHSALKKGVQSLRDFIAVLDRGCKQTDGEPDAALQWLDKNSDGQVSRGEFKEFMAALTQEFLDKRSNGAYSKVARSSNDLAAMDSHEGEDTTTGVGQLPEDTHLDQGQFESAIAERLMNSNSG